MPFMKKNVPGFMINSLRKAIFLDRDGVLNVDKNYVVDPKDLEVPNDVPANLKRLAAQGWELVVITNQSGVARGYFDLPAVNRFHDALKHEIQQRSGVELRHFYICPHHPDGKVQPYAAPCDCRKPAPGLLKQASRDLGIALEHSIIIGDKASDVDCGIQAGVTTIQIVTDQYPAHAQANYSCKNFQQATDWILQHVTS